MDPAIDGPNPIHIRGNSIEVDIGDGFIALFDLEDLDKISQYKWAPHHNGNKTCPFGCRDHIYPIAWTRKIRAHNLVMDFTPHGGLTIDHVNKNTLDNRKSNLRIATKAMQSINHMLHRNSTTGRAGVSVYSGKSKMYAANWYENGQKIRKYFSVAKYGDGAHQMAVEARLAAERRIPEYAEALYNRKLVVQKLAEITGEVEWNLSMPELLAELTDFGAWVGGVDIETMRC